MSRNKNKKTINPIRYKYRITENDKRQIRTWVHELNNAYVEESKMWYALRALCSTRYGALVASTIDDYAHALLDNVDGKDDFANTIIDVVSKFPMIMHPEYEVLAFFDIPREVMKRIIITAPDDSPFLDAKIPYDAFNSPSEAINAYHDCLFPVRLSEVKGTITTDKPLTEVNPTILSGMHEIDIHLHPYGYRMKYLGSIGDQEVFSIVKNATHNFYGLPVSYPDSLDYCPVERMNSYEREYVENEIPVPVIRDLALFSMVTDCEVLFPIPEKDESDDEFGIDDLFPFLPDDKGSVKETSKEDEKDVILVSSMDIEWALSPYERSLARFCSVMNRLGNVVSRCAGFPNQLSIINKLGLDNTGSTSIESMVLHNTTMWVTMIKDHNLMMTPLDFSAGDMVHVPRHVLILKDADLSASLEVSLPDDFESKTGIKLDELSEEESARLQDVITNMVDPDKLNMNHRQAAITLRMINAVGYSIVVAADEAIQEDIDPLAPLPRFAPRDAGLTMENLLGTMSWELDRLGHSSKVQYLGRRKTDGRYVFVYVDEHGHTANPQFTANMNITM